MTLREWCEQNNRLDLLNEWHPTKNNDLTPNDVFHSSRQKIWWLGKCGHEWDAQINNRVYGHQGCPYCSGTRVLVGVNDLASQYPEIAAEWHSVRNKNLSATDVFVKSNKKVWWICSKGHEWEAVVGNRTKNNTGCPYCSGRKPIQGVNDLLTLRPDVANEWHPTKNDGFGPSDVACNSSIKVWWQCEKGHEWYTAVCHRTGSNHTGCPYCSGQKILLGFNDLASQYPDIAKEWHPTKNGKKLPNQYTVHSGIKVWWQCEKGHDYDMKISHRVDGHKCPYCCNYKILQGFNDLATTHPQIANEWNYDKNGDLLPQQVIGGSSKKIWWKCNEGHEWQASLNSRTTSDCGCPICSESHLEKLVRQILNKYDYCFREQIRFEDLKYKGYLSYDFGVYDDTGNLCVLIECQGIQHYKPIEFFGGQKQYKEQVSHDDMKRDYCLEKGIRLIEIPYYYNEAEIDGILSILFVNK